MILKITIPFLLCVSTVFGQTGVFSPVPKQEIVDAYERGCSWFTNTSSYSFKVRYSSFPDHHSTQTQEESEGFYTRNNKLIVSSVLGIKTIQSDSLKIVIDTTNKLVSIIEAPAAGAGMVGRDELLSMLDNTRSMQVAKFKKALHYRIEFSPNSLFEAYEFHVNDRGIIERLIYYYGQQSKEDYTENGLRKKVSYMRPRLEISFISIQVPSGISPTDEIRLFIDLKTRGKAILTGPLENYRLQDYRRRKKK